MGQQQLLLIALGIILVGIAVIVGINIFSASATSTNRDNVVADLVAIASIAREYYTKPRSLAGGGNSFTGFSVPMPLRSTTNGTYTATVRAQSVRLTGTGKEKGNNGTSAVRVIMTVTPAGITSTSIRN